MCVLKEIPVITFSLWHIRLLARLMCRYGQNKNYMHGNAIIKFTASSTVFNSLSTVYIYIYNAQPVLVI